AYPSYECLCRRSKSAGQLLCKNPLSAIMRECPDSQLPSNNSCGLGFFEGDAGAVNFGEDFGAGGLPLVGLWIGVALGKIRLDITHQFVDRGEAVGADHIACQCSAAIMMAGRIASRENVPERLFVASS